MHLHVHTEYSLLDGAARISKLVKTAKAHGAPAVAISDHGAMYGVYKFFKECKKQGIKGIIGCEIYIVDDMNNRNHKEHRGHLVLLAKNNVGYLNLCKINTAAWRDGFYSKPRIDYKFLKKHSEGLICLSGCLAGHIPNYLLKGMYDEAKKYALDLKSMFGKDFYIELQDFGHPDNALSNPLLIKLAGDIGVELVATNDVHYINKEDAFLQDVLMCVEMKKSYDDPNRLKFPAEEFYVKTYDEMYKLFGKTAPSALSNTIKIAEKCDANPFFEQQLIPVFQTPDGSTNVQYFRNQIEDGLKERYGKITPDIKKRYEHEFSVIADNGFIDYFLIVADFMKFANDNDIAVGPGRGSGAGSIIAYALNITKLDPFRYNLLFERFLHSERINMPDFDLDFCCNRREEVIEYVRNKYGDAHVAQIVTFGTLAAKAAIKDIARVFNMPYQDVDKITKPMQFAQTMRPPMLPYVFDLKDIQDPKKDPGFKDLDERTQERLIDDFTKDTNKLNELRNRELIEIYQNDEHVRKIVDMAVKVEGFPRNCSTHAAGVIICKEIVGNITPLQRNGEDITTQFDMKECEELGMLKMDFLGLITLTDIQMTIEQLRAAKKKNPSAFEKCPLARADFDFYKIQYNDQDAYKMMGEGDTDAVFQMETGGFKRFLRDLKPDCIEDIIAAVSLYRPGPMDMIPDYCKNKHNPALTKYDHPLLADILRNTYGQIVYQEQVMDIFRVMGGYNLGQADMVRRAMGKKDLKEMARQKEIFIYGDEKTKIKGAISKGVTKEIATKIFNKMAKFAGYAFNKSHAACYAYIAYQTAYLKFHYYPYYMASVLNNRVNKWDDMTYYIVSVRNNGTNVLPPDINKSQTYFTVEEGENGERPIRFGLSALKNVGTALVNSILEERTKCGPFRSFQDFCNRVEGGALNKRCLESLIFSGAFDSMGKRSQLMAVYPAIVKLVSSEKKATDAGQVCMFGIGKLDESTAIPLPRVPEFDESTKLKFEKEVVGIYLSGHPLSDYSKVFENLNFDTRHISKETDEENPAEQPTEFEHNAVITMGGIISDVKRLQTKATRKDMAVITVEDLYGICEIMIFPAVYDRCKNLLEKDAVIKINGRLSVRDGEANIILADSIESLNGKLDDTKKKEEPPVCEESCLYLKYNMSDTSLHDDVMRTLESFKAKGTMKIVIRNTATGKAVSPTLKVRNVQGLISELESILTIDNVVVR